MQAPLLYRTVLCLRAALRPYEVMAQALQGSSVKQKCPP